MIENERQYKITKKQAANLEAALKQSLESSQTISAELQEAAIKGIQSQLDDLNREIREYEAV